MGFTRFAEREGVDAASGLVEGTLVNVYAWPNGPPSFVVERVRADCSHKEITHLGVKHFDSARAMSSWELSDDELPQPVGSNDFAKNDLAGLCTSNPSMNVANLEAAAALVQAWPPT
jgi:hypothetical protein